MKPYSPVSGTHFPHFKRPASTDRQQAHAPMEYLIASGLQLWSVISHASLLGSSLPGGLYHFSVSFISVTLVILVPFNVCRCLFRCTLNLKACQRTGTVLWPRGALTSARPLTSSTYPFSFRAFLTNSQPSLMYSPVILSEQALQQS